MVTRYKPVNTEPPYIPSGDVYKTHRPGEWIAITDELHADVLGHATLEDYQMSFVGLSTGKIWIHIETSWEKYKDD